MNLTNLFHIEDRDGNILFCNDKGHLTLQVQSKSYRIGTVTECKKPFSGYNYWKNEKEQYVYRKADAWSVGYEILKRMGEGHVIIFTEKGRYNISAKEAMEKGSFLHFKKSGVEKKIYIPRKHFNFLDEKTIKR